MQGIIDFTLVSGGSTGKAMHFYVNEDIADLSSIYTVLLTMVAVMMVLREYTFPAEAATGWCTHLLVEM